MKRLIVILLSIIILSCNKDELPKETQQGEDTFGMLVNGVLWQPYQPGTFTPGDNKPDIYYYSSADLIYFYIKNFDTDEIFYFSIDNVKDLGTYCANSNLFLSITDSLNFYCQDTTRFEYNYDCNSSYKLKKSSNSIVNITHFDITERIVAGTFEMELISDSKDTLNITKGVFDSHFITLNND